MCPECLITMAQYGAAALPMSGAVAALIVNTVRSNKGVAAPSATRTEMEDPMNRPQTATREEWLAARTALLVKEKALTRQIDALSAERRRLPMVALDKDYRFDDPGGPTTLKELFGGRRQLIVYHFMFDPTWEEGCKSCSHFMDNAAGSIVHLAARDTSFVVVSRAPIAKIERFKTRMGWSFRWVSSFGTDFNDDFRVTIDPEGAEYVYNYTSAKTLVDAGKIWFPKGELPGISVFLREDDRVFHTYSAYQRGLDLPLNTYNFLDLTPLGRQEEDGRIQAWIRHHDRYPA